MNGFTVTYEIYTPESLENGDKEETGFCLSGGWNIPIEEALADKEGDYTMSLREALGLASPLEDSGNWFSEIGESRCNYATGEIELRAIHPPRNITPSSYQRIKRLIGAH